MNSNHPPVQKRSLRDVCRSLQAALARFGRRATLHEIRRWTRGQREQASEWAWKSVLVATDNNVRVPPIPPHVAALPLSGGPSEEARVEERGRRLRAHGGRGADGSVAGVAQSVARLPLVRQGDFISPDAPGVLGQA